MLDMLLGLGEQLALRNSEDGLSTAVGTSVLEGIATIGQTSTSLDDGEASTTMLSFQTGRQASPDRFEQISSGSQTKGRGFKHG